MWKPFTVDNIGYIIKNVSVDGHHKVLLSNFLNMWGGKMERAHYRYCKMAASERCIGDRDISVMRRGRGMT